VQSGPTEAELEQQRQAELQSVQSEEVKQIDKRIQALERAKVSLKVAKQRAFGRSDSKKVRSLQNRGVKIDDELAELREGRAKVSRGEVSASGLKQFAREKAILQQQRDISRREKRVVKRQQKAIKAQARRQRQRAEGRGVFVVQGPKGPGTISTRRLGIRLQAQAEETFLKTETRKVKQNDITRSTGDNSRIFSRSLSLEESDRSTSNLQREEVSKKEFAQRFGKAVGRTLIGFTVIGPGKIVQRSFEFQRSKLKPEVRQFLEKRDIKPKALERTLKTEGPLVLDPDVQSSIGAATFLGGAAVLPTAAKVVGVGLAGISTKKSISSPTPENIAETALLVTPALPTALRKTSDFARTARLKEIPKEQVIAPEFFKGQEFPLIRKGQTAGELKAEFKPLLPGETKAAGFTASPGTFKKQTETLPGSSEVAGLFQAPRISPHFLRVTEAEKPKLNLNIFGTLKPTVARVTPKEVRLVPGLKAGETKPSFRDPKKLKQFFQSEAERGVSFVPFIKREKEAVIPVGSKLVQTQKRFFFKFQGRRIPIQEFETRGGIVPKKSPLKKTITVSKKSSLTRLPTRPSSIPRSFSATGLRSSGRRSSQSRSNKSFSSASKSSSSFRSSSRRSGRSSARRLGPSSGSFFRAPPSSPPSFSPSRFTSPSSGMPRSSSVPRSSPSPGSSPSRPTSLVTGGVPPQERKKSLDLDFEFKGGPGSSSLKQSKKRSFDYSLSFSEAVKETRGKPISFSQIPKQKRFSGFEVRRRVRRKK
jgi:hypothetical protein